jgi:hypothetical protein
MQGRYSHTHLGQDNALRSLLLAVVIALAALRILLAQRPGPLPSVVALLCGVALILFATLTDHDTHLTVVLEIIVGAWVIVMALLTFDHPPRAPAADPAARSGRRGGTRGHVLGPRAAEDVRIAAVALTISAAVLALFQVGRRVVSHAGHSANVD